MRRFFWFPILSLCLLVSFEASLAEAATIDVTTLTDEDTDNGLCSLREAVANANSGSLNPDCTAGSTSSAVTDDIVLNVTGTYSLMLGQLSVAFNSPIAIAEAPGVDATISAGGLSRIFSLTSSSATALTLTALTLRDGAVASDGGCIFLSGSNGAHLTITDSQFENCSAGDQGGAIYVLGLSHVVSITGSTFTGNSAATQGGAIYSNGTAIALATADTDFTENTAGAAGGAIYATLASAATFTGGTFSENAVSGGTDARGGALWIFTQTGSSTASAVTFTRNSVTGGTSSNEGGAIFVNGGGLNLSGSALTSNSATGTNARGGAISVGDTGSTDSSIQISTSRIESNSADAGGGAIYSEAESTQAVLTSCIVGNGDLAISNAGITTLAANGSGNVADANWWGSANGPRIAGAPAGTGSSISPADAINGDGVTPVDVGLTSSGPAYTTPTGSWLAAAPTVAGQVCRAYTGCPSQPLNTCLAAGKTSVSYKLGSDPAKNKFKWKWGKGVDAEMQSDFGDPLAGGTTYSVCVYDSVAGVAALETGAVVSPLDSCGDTPCWKAVSDKGWSFKSKDGNALGVTKVSFKGGDAGKPAIQVQGKGAALQVPSPSVDKLLAQDTSVIVQLIRSDASRCWSSTFTAAKKNDLLQFSATAP